MIFPFLLLFLFIFSAVTLGDGSYWDFLTIGQGDRRYCMLLGTCTINNLVVDNLSVIGTFFNVSVVNYNVTGNIEVQGNIVAREYYGRFNWYIVPGLSLTYLSFNRTHLAFNESQLNLTISEVTAATIYLPWNVTTIYGTHDGGNLTSILTAEDGDTFNISEGAGANALEVTFNFTGVLDFNHIVLRLQYLGGQGHEIEIGLYDYGIGVYEEEYGELTDMDEFAFILYNVLDPLNHLNGTNVSMRLRQVQNGLPTHDLFIDYISLVDGFTTITTNEHDGLSSRDDIENHPWALPINGSKRNATDIFVTGTVTANLYDGNGSLLTGVATGLDSAYNLGENVIYVDTDNIIFNISDASQPAIYVKAGVDVDVEFLVDGNNLGGAAFLYVGDAVDDVGAIYLRHNTTLGILDTDGGSDISIGKSGGNTIIENDLYVDSLCNASGDCFTLTELNYSADLTNYWDEDGDIDADEISESKINFVTACAPGNHYYLSGNDLACESDDDTTYTNSSFDLSQILNTGDVTIGEYTLTVKNISSPFENKSYIFFEPDGSVGITLDPIEPPEIPPTKEKETTTKTASTKTTCKDGRCNLILYSGIRFVKEDNVWKELWEARSLKDSGIKCIVESDGIHLAECEDFNYTHRRIKTSINSLSAIDKTKVPITVYSEEYNFETEKIEVIEKSKEVYNFELTPNRDEWIKASYGDIIKVGDKSTTIMLQESDTENLDDAYVNKNPSDDDDCWGATPVLSIRPQTTDTSRTYIKFNISAIPSEQSIDSATLYLYQYWDEGAMNILVHHLYYHNWTEGTVVSGTNVAGQDYTMNITWNNQPCGTAFDDFNACNLTHEDNRSVSTTDEWKAWTVTNMVKMEYDNEYKNISIVLIGELNADPSTEHAFRSKEYTTDVTKRPYLNITYSEAEAPSEPAVTSTLVNPTDASIDIDGDVTFNCSATATNSVLKNISLYHNLTGWGINQTNNVSGTSNSTTFTITNIANGTNLVWNCLASNNETNTSFADANYTLSIVFPVPKNPKFFIQNMSGIKQWWINSVGDMWLRNSLTVDTNTLYVDALNDRVGIGTTSPSYPFEVQGKVSGISIYASANVSADDYLTRTSVFDKNKNVWDYIKDVEYYKEDGEIKHSNFYGYSTYTIDNQTIEGVSLNKEIDLLRQANYELNQRLIVIETFLQDYEFNVTDFDKSIKYCCALRDLTKTCYQVSGGSGTRCLNSTNSTVYNKTK